jgi:hypothetical protein
MSSHFASLSRQSTEMDTLKQAFGPRNYPMLKLCAISSLQTCVEPILQLTEDAPNFMIPLTNTGMYKSIPEYQKIEGLLERIAKALNGRFNDQVIFVLKKKGVEEYSVMRVRPHLM